MNPFALFLIVAGTGLCLGSGFVSTGWNPLAFVGVTVMVLGFLIEWGCELRKARRRR